MKNFIRSMAITGVCSSLAWSVGGSGGSASSGAGAGAAATSNGTTSGTNPSSVGSVNTPPQQIGGGVGTGNVSKSTTHSSESNQDYQNTVRVYGANSDQAKAVLARQQKSTHSASRAAGGVTNGQTFPSNGTFAPSINSGSGAGGTTSGVSTGAGMATGTGTGAAASTNGSPTAH